MSRYSDEARCEACGLRRSRCICEGRENLRLPWDLVVVQHHRERHKPSNTARWLETVVENCERWLHALPGQPLDPGRFDREGPQYVLFPSEDSQTLGPELLDEWRQAARPIRLFVPDGTWRNASRMVRRVDGLARLPRVQLPEGAPSRWPMRRTRMRQRLCTFEAVLRLSVMARHRDSSIPLERAFQALLDAQRASRAQERGADGPREA